VELWLGDGSEDVDCLINFLAFHVEPADVYGSGQTPFAHLGAIYLEPEWEIRGDEPARLIGQKQEEKPALATTSDS